MILEEYGVGDCYHESCPLKRTVLLEPEIIYSASEHGCIMLVLFGDWVSLVVGVFARMTMPIVGVDSATCRHRKANEFG